MMTLPTYEQFKKDEVLQASVKDQVQKVMKEAVEKPEVISMEMTVKNVVFTQMVLAEAIDKIRELEEYVFKLEENMDGNRFTTKGIDL